MAVAAAIKSALVVPDSPKNNDLNANDVVDVTFDYKDGRVSDAKVKYSSDERADDAALLEAVAAARYPPTPAAYVGKVLHLTMEYNFNNYIFSPAWARANSDDVQVQGDFDQTFAATIRDAIPRCHEDTEKRIDKRLKKHGGRICNLRLSGREGDRRESRFVEQRCIVRCCSDLRSRACDLSRDADIFGAEEATHQGNIGFRIHRS